MNLPQDNLFLRLHKWAVRQDENFLTEVFAYLLQHLLDHEPVAAVDLLKDLSGGFFKVRTEDVRSVEVRPQVALAEGKPDLQISTASQLAYIEVKSESPVNYEQLKRYLESMKSRGFESTRLVLLTRYPASLSELDEESKATIYATRWYQVASWLEQQCSRYSFKAVSKFLVEQFLGFLGARGMAFTFTQVSKYMPEGLRAWGSLLNMLLRAAEDCNVSATIVARKEYIGVKVDGGKYWIGLEYANPEKLWFCTGTRIIVEAAAKLGVGELDEESWIPGRYRWSRSEELDSEPVHFFARSKVRQMEWLQAFLQECLAQARSIETPDQPPLPEEPEGN